jgi:hypothetical protein
MNAATLMRDYVRQVFIRISAYWRIILLLNFALENQGTAILESPTKQNGGFKPPLLGQSEGAQALLNLADAAGQRRFRVVIHDGEVIAIGGLDFLDAAQVQNGKAASP